MTWYQIVGVLGLLCMGASMPVTAQQPATPWHGIAREMHYKPQGKDFVKVSGRRRFNRALYGTNTAFRVEAGDLPEFALYMPGMGGNLKLGLIKGEDSKWLIDASSIKTLYRPGAMVYEIKDTILGTGSLVLTVLALADGEGLILKVETKSIPAGITLVTAFGGATGKKFSRDGDIGADPESSFNLKPEYCKDNIYTLNKNGFALQYGSGKVQTEAERYEINHSEEPVKAGGSEKNTGKEMIGVFPTGTALHVGDANEQASPFTVTVSQKTATPLVSGTTKISGSNSYYFLIQNPKASRAATAKDLKAIFDRAEASRKLLAERVVVQIPDSFINTLGGALSMAADAIWEDPTFMHGAVAWRMRLNGWRGAYVADPLGWHDRAKAHFNSYAKSQLTTPADGPVTPDTALHLARQKEKLGTTVFSEGYICRNPNGDYRPHHYDMNLVFIDQLLNHFNWTGDIAYVREMWPVLERHLAWEKRNFDKDGDGLYDAYAAIWASDALQYSGGGVAHSSAYNYRSNKTAAMLAKLIGKDGTPYEREAQKIHKAMQEKLWLAPYGWYAEYQDLMGAKNVHAAAAAWTVYHTMDAFVPDPFQAYQMLQYADKELPHIPVQANGLNERNLAVIATTNWQPYTWSINNVALAEILHTAFAFWQGGRSEEAYNLWKSGLVESMYLSASPGGFEQLSFYDAIRGELYRDFADPVGMAGRSLVEGLFGIVPDALNDTLSIHPGFPEEWNHASLAVPDVVFSFVRNGLEDRYTVKSSFSKGLSLKLEVPFRNEGIESVTVNGKPAAWKMVEGVGMPVLRIVAGKQKTYSIVVGWKGEKLKAKEPEQSVAIGNAYSLDLPNVKVLQVSDPQNILKQVSHTEHAVKGTVDGEKGNRTFFIQVQQGEARWWMPVNIEVTKLSSEKEHSAINWNVPIDMPFSTVSLSSHFNSRVADIFKQQYLSPRPDAPTLQLPTQGIGNWCYPLVSADIDDAGLREKAGTKNELVLANSLRFATPSDSNQNNIAFTSLWDNFPDSLSIPLSGKSSHAFFLMAGTTNHMQSQMVNGVLRVQYTDGTYETLELKNPENWWPIEQDYYEDGYAFHRKTAAPLRIHLKDGSLHEGYADEKSYTTIKGYSNRVIDGGAATVLDMPLDGTKTLKSLTLKPTANDVVIGLMGVTLGRTPETERKKRR